MTSARVPLRWTLTLLLLVSLARQIDSLVLEEFIIGACLALDDDVIRYHVPYHVCTDLCRGRDDCRAISFWPKLSTCRLNMADTGDLSADQAACVFSKKADWSQQTTRCDAGACPETMGCREQCGQAVCYEQDCVAPGGLTNGQVLGSSTSRGATRGYSCNKGYIFTGNETITCTETGWSAPVPGCNGRLITGLNGVHLVPNNKLTASSVHMADVHGTTSYESPTKSRLYTTFDGNHGSGGWSPATSSVNEWIQVEFSSAKTIIGVALQGKSTALEVEQWVTHFKVLYSDSCNPQQFTVVQDADGNDVVFDGNSNRDTVVTRYLSTEISARCVRINPVAWRERPTVNDNDYIGLRFDVIGR